MHFTEGDLIQVCEDLNQKEMIGNFEDYLLKNQPRYVWRVRIYMIMPASDLGTLRVVVPVSSPGTLCDESELSACKPSGTVATSSFSHATLVTKAPRNPIEVISDSEPSDEEMNLASTAGRTQPWIKTRQMRSPSFSETIQTDQVGGGLPVASSRALAPQNQSTHPPRPRLVGSPLSDQSTSRDVIRTQSGVLAMGPKATSPYRQLRSGKANDLEWSMLSISCR